MQNIFAKRYINFELYSIPSSLGGTSDYNAKHGMVIVGGAVCLGAPFCFDYREVHLVVVQCWVDLDLGQSGMTYVNARDRGCAKNVPSVMELVVVVDDCPGNCQVSHTLDGIVRGS